MSKDLIAANRLALAGALTPGMRHDVNNRCSVIMNNMSFAPTVLGGLQDQLGSLESMLRSGKDVAELGLFVQGLRSRVDADVAELGEVFGECLDAARGIVSYNKAVGDLARGGRARGETVDVLVMAAVDTAALWQRKSVEVQVGELPAWPVADSDLFFQLALNLVLNARQAFESAEPGNRIEVFRDGASLVVENNGRAGADPRMSLPGLGLWASQQICQELGLELAVDLREDGARVSVTFPGVDG